MWRRLNREEGAYLKFQLRGESANYRGYLIERGLWSFHSISAY